MKDIEILRKALERYRNATHENAAFKDNVIIFLEKEIDRYRDKIKKKDERINDLISRCDALFDITTKKSAQEVTTEQAADGGIMTLTRKTASWTLVTECLLTNGYFVCCHFDDENDGETITIEYWRA